MAAHVVAIALLLGASDARASERDITLCFVPDTQNLANPFCPSTVMEYVNAKYFPGYCTMHTSTSGTGEEETQPRERTIEY